MAVRSRRWWSAFATAGVVGLLASAPAYAAVTVPAGFTDLGTTLGTPRALSLADEVLGDSSVWRAGTIVTPGNVPGAATGAASMNVTDISPDGLVVGYAYDADGQNTHAVYWQQRTTLTPYFYSPFADSGSSPCETTVGTDTAVAVDSADEIGGLEQYVTPNNSNVCTGHDVVYVAPFGGADAAQVDLGNGGPLATFEGIQPKWSVVDVSNSSYLVPRGAGSLPANPLPDYVYSETFGANGYVFGNHLLAADGSTISSGADAFQTSAGVVTPLAIPSGAMSLSTYLTAMNDSHEIVGQYEAAATGTDRAVLWTSPTAQPIDLSTLPSIPAGWTLTNATAINDNGDIAGIATDQHGVVHAFLLSSAQLVPPVVNSTGDSPASDPSSGSCNTGSKVADAGGQQVPECTLRAAIQAVNAIGTPGQKITFNIPSAALGPIKLSSNLPAITAPGTVVDGASEAPGKIQILGTGAATGTPSGVAGCLDVHALDVTLSRLYVGSCQVGIELEAPGHDVLSGDVIGLSTDGETRMADNYGVWVSNSPSDTVGGVAAAARDVISDNIRGVVIQDPGSSADVVQGDLIGTDATGSGFAPDEYGVTVFDADADTIGSASLSTGAAGSAPGNVIVAAPGTSASANFAVGILGVSVPAKGDVIAGNLIGTNATGSELNPAGGPGLEAVVAGDASGDQVRNNVIAGASADQVAVDGIDASVNTVAGNLIGVTHTGTSALETKNARGVLVAGADATQILGNQITGQSIGVSIQGKAVPLSAGLVGGLVPGTSRAGDTAAVVSNNVIGPLPDGRSVPADAQQVGIYDSLGTSDQIGPGNEVSYNKAGLLLLGTTKAIVFGNRIGTDKVGTSALPNGFGMVLSDAEDTTLGRSGRPDTVSDDSGGGIVVTDSTRTAIRDERVGTTVLGNAALRSYRGALPWGDLDNTTFRLPSGKTFEIKRNAGIAVLGASARTTIGGRGTGVVISGIRDTDSDGLLVEDRGPVTVERAKIGVGEDGKTPVPNAGIGVLFTGELGDAPDGSAFYDSIVAHNHIGVGLAHGVRRTLIRLNSIYDNPDGGILDQTNEVPTAPQLKDAHDLRLGILVSYHVDVPGFDKGKIDFYASPSCERNGAGKDWIGVEKATVSEKKTAGLITRLAVGTAITATLTTDGRGTSEFSNCIELKAKPK